MLYISGAHLFGTLTVLVLATSTLASPHPSPTRVYSQVCLCLLSIAFICIHFQVKQVLLPFTSNRVAVAEGKLEELYTAIPFPDKER